MLDVLTLRLTAQRSEEPVGVRRVVDEEPHPAANALSRSMEEQTRRTPPR
jgi:hypothetical protein